VAPSSSLFPGHSRRASAGNDAGQRFLEGRGHDVKVCGTGKVTMRCLSDSEWDVLLLDLKLPDADGADLLAKVRKSHEELQTIMNDNVGIVRNEADLRTTAPPPPAADTTS